MENSKRSFSYKRSSDLLGQPPTKLRKEKCQPTLRKNHAVSHISSLPSEVLARIISFLPSHEQRSMPLVHSCFFDPVNALQGEKFGKLDFIPGVSLQDQPPYMDGSMHNVLLSEKYFCVVGPFLRSVRLQIDIKPVMVKQFLQSISMGMLPNLSTLAFKDGGAFALQLADKLLCILSIQNIEVLDPTEKLLRKLYKFPKLNELHLYQLNSKLLSDLVWLLDNVQRTHKLLKKVFLRVCKK